MKEIEQHKQIINALDNLLKNNNNIDENTEKQNFTVEKDLLFKKIQTEIIDIKSKIYENELELCDIHQRIDKPSYDWVVQVSPYLNIYNSPLVKLFLAIYQ